MGFWESNTEPSGVAEIKRLFDGQRLLGFMKLGEDEEERRNADNAIAIYFGESRKPKCAVLYTPNQNYSMYDKWNFELVEPLPRDERYKAIGEIMHVIINDSAKDTWTDEVNTIQFVIKTRTKELRFGHHWNDCHYPNSLWEES